MPYYEYHCPDNGRTVEVRHGMSERLETWQQVSERAELDADVTAPDAPVVRLMSAPVPVGSSGTDAGPASCGSACACMPSA